MSGGSLSTPSVLVLPTVRREIANPDNYSTAGSVVATQDGTQLRLDVTSTTREMLTGDRTYFVRTDGDDANSGLGNDAASAFLTVQGALDAIARIDFAGYTVTVDVQPGTYSGRIFIPVMTGQAAPSDLHITCSSSGAILTSGASFEGLITANAGARARIGNVALTGGGTAIGIQVFPGGAVEIAGCEFGAGLFAGINCDGGFLRVVGDYTVSGGGYSHLLIEAGGYYHAFYAGTITLVGTPVFGGAYIQCDFAAVARIEGMVFSGGATGARYIVNNNAVIKVTNGDSGDVLPGDSAGSATNGGRYAF